MCLETSVFVFPVRTGGPFLNDLPVPVFDLDLRSRDLLVGNVLLGDGHGHFFLLGVSHHQRTISSDLHLAFRRNVDQSYLVILINLEGKIGHDIKATRCGLFMESIFLSYVQLALDHVRLEASVFVRSVRTGRPLLNDLSGTVLDLDLCSRDLLAADILFGYSDRRRVILKQDLGSCLIRRCR